MRRSVAAAPATTVGDFTPMLRINPSWAMRAVCNDHNVMPEHELPQDGVASELLKGSSTFE
jgi:hypothetical protein